MEPCASEAIRSIFFETHSCDKRLLPLATHLRTRTNALGANGAALATARPKPLEESVTRGIMVPMVLMEKESASSTALGALTTTNEKRKDT